METSMLSQLTNLLPSIKLPFLDRFTASVKSLPACEIHNLESATDKPARTLKHLLKLNHAKHAVLQRDNGLGVNYVPRLLSTAYLLGATAETLHDLYEAASEQLESWSESPDGMTTADWHTFFGKREYETAFVHFFEDEVARKGYDWEHVVEGYLCDEEKRGPLVDCLVSGDGHPLVHLGYGIEMSSRQVCMEALAMAATNYNCVHEYIDSFRTVQPSAITKQASTPFELFQRIRNDARLDALFKTPGQVNISTLLTQHSAIITEYLHVAPLPLNPPRGLDLTPHFRAIQEAAVTLFSCAFEKQFDLPFLHLLTSTHALRVLFSFIPAKHHLSLLRQWYLLAITTYIAQLRPEIMPESIDKMNVEGMDREWARKTAMSGPRAGDVHYLEAVRTLWEVGMTWAEYDQNSGRVEGHREEWYLKATVRFVEEFAGWRD